MCDVLNPFYFYSLSDFPRPWMTSLFTGRWENHCDDAGNLFEN